VRTIKTGGSIISGGGASARAAIDHSLAAS